VMMFVGAAKLQLGADAEGLACCRQGLEANRNHPLSHFQYAAALALHGHMNEALPATLAGLALDPGFTLRRFRAIFRVTTRLTAQEAGVSTKACVSPGCQRGDVGIGHERRFGGQAVTCGLP
jgi:hypothetical protein